MKEYRFDEAKMPLGSNSELRSSTGLTSRIRSFKREEDGNLTILSVFMFVGIVAICGVGVDLMMNEMNRTRLQGTLDRAILAAADLDQKRDPETVVEDYFEAAGLSHALLTVDSDRTANYSTVSATAHLSTDPLFISVLGIDELVAPAAGIAEERVGNVEVSMVLDISGSMGWDSAQPDRSKLDVLQDAAELFLDTVLDPENGGITTVNIVPYNHTVNLGSTFASYMSLDDNHDYSNCVRFSGSDFSETAVPPSQTLDRLSHFDIWSNSWYTSEIDRPVCPTSDYAEIKVHQMNKTDLVAHINSFNAGGNTAIDLGMKWGVALLDDAMEPVVTDMIDDELVNELAESRPAAFDDRESMKIIVLMTDGENTSQWDLPASVQTGMSRVFIDDRGTSSTSDDRFSVLIDDNSGTSNDIYFWERYRDYSWNSRYRYGADGSNARRMSHAELYARFDADTVRSRFHYKPYYDGWLSWSEYQPYSQEYETFAWADLADDRLSAVCQAARDENIVVYAVSFEAPQRGVTAMQDCASSDSHFFDVEGTELADAFEVIASTINQLRLTQ